MQLWNGRGGSTSRQFSKPGNGPRTVSGIINAKRQQQLGWESAAHARAGMLLRCSSVCTESGGSTSPLSSPQGLRLQKWVSRQGALPCRAASACGPRPLRAGGREGNRPGGGKETRGLLIEVCNGRCAPVCNGLVKPSLCGYARLISGGLRGGVSTKDAEQDGRRVQDGGALPLESGRTIAALFLCKLPSVMGAVPTSSGPALLDVRVTAACRWPSS